MMDFLEVNGRTYDLNDETSSVLRSSDLHGTTFEQLLTPEQRQALADVREQLDNE